MGTTAAAALLTSTMHVGSILIFPSKYYEQRNPEFHKIFHKNCGQICGTPGYYEWRGRRAACQGKLPRDHFGAVDGASIIASLKSHCCWYHCIIYAYIVNSFVVEDRVAKIGRETH